MHNVALAAASRSATLTASTVDIGTAIGSLQPIRIDFGSWSKTSNRTVVPPQSSSIDPKSLITAAPKARRCSGFLDCIESVGNVITSGAGSLLGDITSGAGSVASDAASSADSLVSEAKSYYTSLSNAAEASFTSITNAAEATFTSLTNAAEATFASITSDASSLASSLASEGSSVFSVASASANGLINQASSQVESAISVAAGEAASLINHARSEVTGIIASASALAGQAEKAAASDFNSILSVAESDAVAIVGAASSRFSQVVSDASSFAVSAESSATQWAVSVEASATAWVVSVEASATAAVASFYSSASAAFPKVTASLAGNIANLDFDTLKSSTTVDTPWDIPGYQIGHEIDEHGAAIDIYCVGCGVQAELAVTGSVSFVLGLDPSISDGSISIAGALAATLGLGIEAKYEHTWSIDKMLFLQGIPELSIGEIFILGPSIRLDVGGDFTIDAVGTILAGVGLVWPNINATLDIIDSSRSGTQGFSNVEVNPVLDIAASIDMSADAYVQARIQFGIDIGLQSFQKHYDIGLVEQPELLLNASLSADIGYSNGTVHAGVGNADCPGVEAGLYFENTVYVDILNSKNITLEVLTTPIYTTCFT